MPVCPVCKSEYRNDVTECKDCKVELVESLPEDEAAAIEFLELYECYDGGEAQRIISLLEDQNIISLIRDNMISAIPTNIGMTGAKRILAQKKKSAEARELINDARNDEIISSEGRFLS